MHAATLYRRLFSLAIVILAIGTFFYHYVEKLQWVDAYYLSVITLTTVGYGDITPQTTAGKVFTTFYIFVGVGVITTFITYSVRRRGDKLQERMKKDKV